MGKLDILSQKLKGKAQQVKGEIEDASGQHMKGKIDKIKGKANVIGADIKTKLEDSKKGVNKT